MTTKGLTSEKERTAVLLQALYERFRLIDNDLDEAENYLLEAQNEVTESIYAIKEEYRDLFGVEIDDEED